MRRTASIAAVFAALALLVWLDGWIPAAAPSAPRASTPPPEISRALREVVEDLSRRARALAVDPEIARSLEGGGIAVRRQALFAGARKAMEGAASGSWIALADPEGNAHAWWGDAPEQIPEILLPGALAVRWSTTRFELLHWRIVGSGAFAGVICAARSLPVEAPGFARALALEGSSLDWEPVAPARGTPTLLSSPEGAALLAGRPSDVPVGRSRLWRRVVLGVLVALGLWLLLGPVAWIGAGLAILFLTALCGAGDSGRLLASVMTWLLASGIAALPGALALLRSGDRAAGALRVAGGYALFTAALVAARGVAVPDLGLTFPLTSVPFLSLVALTALVGASLALAASGGAPSRWRGSTSLAVLATSAAVVAGLLLVSASRLFPLVVGAAAALCFEAWRRSIASAPRGNVLGPFRLIAGATLLVFLVAAPIHEHARAASAYRVASAIRLPDPERVSAGAVVAVRRAVERVERFDLARELPAPVREVDLSDLAYRLWRDGEKQAASPALFAYEVADRAGAPRSRFSLIPEPEAAAGGIEAGVQIDRHRVAVVRQVAVLREAGEPWGRVTVAVADWPGWDPLPPRLAVYERLAGAVPAAALTSRPFLGLYGPDGSPRQEGPELPRRALERVRASRSPEPVRLRFRDEELRGELRPMPEGFQLVAIPGPDFLRRLLTAALLLPAAAVLYVLGCLVALARLPVDRRKPSELFAPGSRTFRGRLVALFVLSVMIPLLAVTFFLRSSIASRTSRDTLDHARTALETARRVLDDYLPSAAAARGRLGLLDDSLLSWLANAVGFDLSVYSPEARLLASSRRDLYAAGLLPSRVPGSSFVAVGLGQARERTDARRIADSRFEEITTALRAVPGAPGVRSPVLLSLLLLPQQRVAEAEAAQLTAAVSAFSLLVFLISAAIAGRFAVRVARPVADLVEGTRAVARGDFSPQLSEPPDEELRELVRAFLYMSRSLKEHTEALSREKERLATLLAQLTAGVVAYGEDRRVLLANPASAHLGGGRVDGATLEEVFPGEPMRPVREVLQRFERGHVSEELEPRPGERWRVVTVPLPLAGAGARMAVIEDVSDVVKSNRLAAWAEMARIIAHEIKNPLTPIRLSVEHLREVWKRQSPEFDRVLEECVQNVLHQTDELRRSASEFSDYARLPGPEMRPADIGALVREAAAAYAGASGIRFELEAPPGLTAMADTRLLARVLSNLIGNSVEALSGRGLIRLSAASGGGRVAVTVEDDGPGVPAEILPRLFDPYFSARSGGTGLGLAIAKKIVEEHGGTIGAGNRAEGGFRVRFDLPTHAAGETSS